MSSDRRRLRSGPRQPTAAAGGAMPDHMAVFRPDDWQQPGDAGPWPGWRRHKTAFLAWTDAQGWTRRQALGFRHPSWVAQGWADEPPVRSS